MNTIPGPKVSIITPIYNPGESLKRCLKSLVSQSYHNIEIILINDGSTDSSDTICNEFAAEEHRIKYFTQENAGVSSARNLGIEMSDGKYLCFVDADDYVDADYIAAMVEAAEQINADLVIQGLKQIRNNQVVTTEIFDEEITEVSALDSAKFDKIFYYCGPYCKLFKTSIVKNGSLKFPADLSYGEDAVFYHAYLEHCRVIVLIHSTAYNYIIANQGSLSTKALSPDKFWQNQSNRRAAYRRLKAKFGIAPELSTYEQNCKLIGIRGMLNAIFKSKAYDKSVREYLSTMVKDVNFGLSKMEVSGIHNNLILRLIKSNNRMSRTILKLMYR